MGRGGQAIPFVRKLQLRLEAKGQTLIPLRLYFSKGKAKVLIAIAKGKKTYDKRHAMADRDAQREIARARREAERDR